MILNIIIHLNIIMKCNLEYIYFTGGNSCSLLLTDEQNNDTSSRSQRISKQRCIPKRNRNIYQNNTVRCECLNGHIIRYQKCHSRIFRASNLSSYFTNDKLINMSLLQEIARAIIYSINIFLYCVYLLQLFQMFIVGWICWKRFIQVRSRIRNGECSECL